MTTQTLRVGTYNMGDGSNDSKYHDLLELAKQGVQILGLEEHGDRESVTNRFVKAHPAWATWYGDGRPGAMKDVILYRKNIGLLTAWQSVTLVGKRHLPKGAGPENASPKVSNRLRFRIGGKRFHFIVGHQYATVNNRRAAARTFLRALADVVRLRRGTVVVVGDFNDKPTSAMLRALRVLLPVLGKTGGTHGKRVIDLILVRGGKTTKTWTVPLSSDHDAVLADVSF